MSGVVWDAFRLGEPLPDSSALARGWPPTPTPRERTGPKASRVTFTSRERPLVTSLAERPFTASAATAAAANVATSAQATRRIRSRRPIPTSATANVTTKSATKLDCEYE